MASERGRREAAADIAARFIARRARRSPLSTGLQRVIRVATSEHDRLLREVSRQRGFVDGWKGIATVIDRSERWCRYMAITATDPLPVFRLGGGVRLLIVDLDAWLERQRVAGMPRAAAPLIEEHW